MTEDMFIVTLGPRKVIVDLWIGVSRWWVSLKHFCVWTTDIKCFTKLSVIVSIRSPNQEVPEYPQKYPSILDAQNPYKACPVNSAGHDCLVLVQFDPGDTFSYSR